MTKKLLIDAHQPEETRVALLNNNRIEEFDYENTFQSQLKGNVYLARVTRVEPSLQAAFVEYGGNRQGFLAFSEIHPDYYRIPVEDREMIEEEAAREDAREDASDAEGDEMRAEEAEKNDAASDDDDVAIQDEGEAKQSGPETLGGEDDVEQPRRSHKAYSRRYRIQEVIARKQILLVQVVKEERGNKGAALTTYLSLAGRYCVLMPNANRGGGVSRKIVNSADRKRLKTIIEDLDVPEGMAVIARTAGAKRTKTEIKRDYAYLAKLWDGIRTKTLESEAPNLIHEEGALVKKAIRDVYTNDIEEVIVEGEEAYKQAKLQMKMLIPSHAKKVVKYEEQPHLFQRYNIEEQLEGVYQSDVTLKSGGYLVINQTEALVAIDVNSGKATKERNVEETALKTNLEAAEEVGRQLKLRDLSGLIVIDFIDMEENRNQNAVERRLKDAVRNDRARIQVGHISHFGLLEMSRQRLRPSLVETVSHTCPHCEGTGRVRSINSSALQMLRVLEQEAERHKDGPFEITMNSEIAVYLLNHKRASIADIEAHYNITIIIEADAHLSTLEYRIGGRVKQSGHNNNNGQNNNGQNNNNNNQQNRRNKNQQKQEQQADNVPNNEASDSPSDSDDDKEDGNKRRRRGRRGGRRRKKRNQDQDGISEEAQNASTEGHNTDDVEGTEQADAPEGNDENEAKSGKSKRRRSRGRGRGKSSEAVAEAQSSEAHSSDNQAAEDAVNQPKEKAEKPTDTAKGKKSAKKAAKKTAKKAAKKSAKNATDADGNEVKEKTELATDADGAAPQAKKAVKKKAAKKAVKKSAKKAAKKAANSEANSEAISGANSGAGTGREPISSTPVDVVEVGGDSAPAKPKKGWWSR